MQTPTILDLQAQLTSFTLTARSLVETYLARIEAIDRSGPRLNAVIELNPDALDRSGCGSSTGSGVAVAADLCVAAIGAETDGSITCPAVAGYPHITVPAGFICGLPVGISFFAGAWSEPTLLRLAYTFEQATQARRAPSFLPAAALNLPGAMG